MTPQEQQALYEANVLNIAQEMMAASTMPLPKNAHNLQTIFVPAARIALKHMNATAHDAWEEGKLSWYKEIGELEEDEEAFVNLNAYLQSRGLVPI